MPLNSGLIFVETLNSAGLAAPKIEGKQQDKGRMTLTDWKQRRAAFSVH